MQRAQFIMIEELRHLVLGQFVDFSKSRQQYILEIESFRTSHIIIEENFTPEERAELDGLQYDEIINSRMLEQEKITHEAFLAEKERINAERTKINIAMRQRQQQAKNSNV